MFKSKPASCKEIGSRTTAASGSTRHGRLSSTLALRASQPPLRKPFFAHPIASTIRAHTTRTPPRDEAPHEPKAEENSGPTIPPHRWIEVLENTASAPWLMALPTAHEDRMKRAYSLLLQVVIYLGRPQDETGQAEQYLVAFETAIVPPDSEIGRARTAIATLTRAIVHDLSSIPLSSPLRKQHSNTFDIFGALLALHDTYLMDVDGKVDEWKEFWSRAQPILLSLGMKLDEDGYGLKDEKKSAA